MEAARQTEDAVEPETPTPEPIVHEMVPEEPFNNKINTYVTDFNSINFTHQGITYGDIFLMNRYERPFTVEMEEYRGYLDLIFSKYEGKSTLGLR